MVADLRGTRTVARWVLKRVLLHRKTPASPSRLLKFPGENSQSRPRVWKPFSVEGSRFRQDIAKVRRLQSGCMSARWILVDKDWGWVGNLDPMR